MKTETETEGRALARRLRLLAKALETEIEPNIPLIDSFVDTLEALLIRKDLHCTVLVALGETSGIDQWYADDQTSATMFEVAGRLHGAATRISLLASNAEHHMAEHHEEMSDDPAN